MAFYVVMRVSLYRLVATGWKFEHLVVIIHLLNSRCCTILRRVEYFDVDFGGYARIQDFPDPYARFRFFNFLYLRDEN